MEGVYFERKCHYMGFWKDDTVADNVIRQMAGMVRNGKGTKCKLHLSNDGLKVTTSSPLGGKNIKDIVAFGDIFSVTVNQYHLQCVLFITKDERRKYRIIGIRCANTTDANLFVSCFKDLNNVSKSVGIGNDLELQRVESGNWTLRAKQPVNQKRQLTSMVDMNAKKMSDRPMKNGVMKQIHTDINSNVDITVEPAEKEKNNMLRTNGSRVQDTNTAAIHTDSLEEKSEAVSEAGLRDELDHLSHEVREIKLMLETSAGKGANETQGQYKEVELIQNEVDEVKEPISAMVLDDDSSEENEQIETLQNRNLNESKSTESTNSDEIRVSVPDYRHSGTKYIRKYVPKEKNHATTMVNDTNGELNSPRLSTTSYDTWKESVTLRTRMARPRSAHLSTYNTRLSLQGSLRDHNPRDIYNTTSKTHRTLPQYSHKVPSMRSTIERPIEKVYPRPRSVHGSIVYRPVVVNQTGNIYSIPTKRVHIDKIQDGGRLIGMKERKEEPVTLKI